MKSALVWLEEMNASNLKMDALEFESRIHEAEVRIGITLLKKRKRRESVDQLSVMNSIHS